ncbi:hypothetical protein ACOMHN_040018 [Nucella lapillus]
MTIPAEEPSAQTDSYNQSTGVQTELQTELQTEVRTEETQTQTENRHSEQRGETGDCGMDTEGEQNRGTERAEGYFHAVFIPALSGGRRRSRRARGAQRGFGCRDEQQRRGLTSLFQRSGSREVPRPSNTTAWKFQTHT